MFSLSSSIVCRICTFNPGDLYMGTEPLEDPNAKFRDPLMTGLPDPSTLNFLKLLCPLGLLNDESKSLDDFEFLDLIE